MGPFIPKKDTSNEDTETRQRNRGRARQAAWAPMFEPLDRLHSGRWRNNYTSIQCSDCGWTTDSFTEYRSTDAFRQWELHQQTAPRVPVGRY